MIKLSPSILSADFANLENDVTLVSKAGADYIHIDVMDGHLVPNISFGTPVMKCIRGCTSALFDVHLMISEPLKYAESFAKAGADIITFHIECDSDTDLTIEKIKSLGCKVGIALNPDSELDRVLLYKDKIDMLLIMTVYAGFGGQKYIEAMNEKIKKAREIFGADFDIEVDGGINLDTLSMPVLSGANVIVAGTGIYGTENPSETVKKFKEFSL